MTLDEIHPTFRAALAAFEAFRRLGFKPEEIFVQRNPDLPDEPLSRMMHVIVLRAGREFSVACGILDSPTWDVQWQELCERVNARSVPEALLAEIWSTSRPRRHAAELCLSLHKQGLLHEPEIATQTLAN